MYYFYRKSNRGHGICPLYRGCLPFGESVIRGFTLLVFLLKPIFQWVRLYSRILAQRKVVICIQFSSISIVYDVCTCRLVSRNPDVGLEAHGCSVVPPVVHESEKSGCQSTHNCR